LARRRAVGTAFLGVLVAGGPAMTAPERAPIHFTDITAQAGIRVTGLGNAAGWIDYDADGDQDLIASNSSIPSDNVWLYRNDGDGTFTDVTQASRLGEAEIRSLAIGDYDNDGWAEIVATTYQFADRPRLYRNLGDGTFDEVGWEAHLGNGPTPWRDSWIDYDRDGWLDLFQANGGSDQLYHKPG
jgi:enediyne biosynthesis protein E4